MAKKERDPYLITRALKTFLWGSIFAAVASQIATTTDAVAVSHIIGPNALSAINLVIPVLSVFTAIMLLFGIGAGVVASKAMGSRDEDKVNSVFSTCVITSGLTGIILGLLTYWSAPVIIENITSGNPVVAAYALTYLEKMCIAIPLLIIAGVLENFVKTDGNPRVVMYAVSSGAVVNLILDIVFMKFLGMGVAGAAYATVINYGIAIIVCLFHFYSPHCTIRWKTDFKNFLRFNRESGKEGLSSCLNNLLIAGCIYAVNSIVLRVEGTEGLYCWSICFQLFLLMQIVLTGISGSTYAIGGMLMGEDDLTGLYLLNRKCIVYLTLSLAVVTGFILLFPDWFAFLFGHTTKDTHHTLPFALRTFSLLLIPYAIAGQLRTIYQINCHNRLSMTISLSQLVVMVLFVFFFSFISTTWMWWGFPISAYSLLLGVISYTVIYRLFHSGLRWITLIPLNEGFPFFNISFVPVKSEADSVEKRIHEFLKENNFSGLQTQEIESDTAILLNSIMQNLNTDPQSHKYIDLHVKDKNNCITLLIKDDGKPFNPLEALPTKERNNEPDYLTRIDNYKYIYDQNMTMVSYKPNDSENESG